MRRLARSAGVLTVSALLVVGCADTVIEEGFDDGTTTADSAPADADSAPGDDTGDGSAPSGTTAELLAEVAEDMSVLSSQIAADGDETATLARIDAAWVVARPDVESTHPELVSGIDTTVEMARTAVVRIRPADADKAYQLLIGLLERYDG